MGLAPYFPQERDRLMREAPPARGPAPLCHFFNSFFLSKVNG